MLLTLTFPLAVSGAITAVYLRIVVVLVSVLERNPVQVGYYVTSARIIENFVGLPMMLVGVALPVLSVSARDNLPRLRYATAQMTQTMALLGALLAVVLGLGAHTVLTVLGGHTYAGAAGALRIQCVMLVTLFSGAALATPLVGSARNREVALATVSGLGFASALAPVLIAPLGAEGAAIAAVGGDVMLCSGLFLAVRASGAGAAFRPGPFVRIALCAIVAAACGSLCSPTSVVAPAVGATTLLVLAVAFGLVPSELLGPVRARAGRVRAAFDGLLDGR